MRDRRPFFRFLCLAVALGAAFTAQGTAAEVVARLPPVMNPFYMTMAGDRLYVVENSSTAHIFKMEAEDVTFVKSFGRAGQGPGEFGFLYLVRVFSDHLEAHGVNKLARFSLDGDYQDEIKFTVPVFKGGIFRVGENFVIRGLDFAEKGMVTTIRLVDKDFRSLKEIGSRTEDSNPFKINLVSAYYSMRVDGDQIFVIDSGKESVVTAFDRNGVQQREMRLPLKPLKMTAALREAIIKPIKEDPEMRTGWAEFEKRIYLPDETPGLDYFEPADGKFYTRTFRYLGNSVEFVIFDQQGKELKRVFLPFTGRLSNGILFCFHDGSFYYLRENPDDDVWELCVENY